MYHHSDLTQDELFRLLRRREITMAGWNGRDKVYGHLRCWSGKKMHPKNRVFFRDEAEAKEAGFRPCGHCMKAEYQAYKRGLGR